MGIPEPLAGTIATRALVSLGQDLVTATRRRGRDSEPVTGGDEDGRPRLRINDAGAPQRSVKRA